MNHSLFTSLPSNLSRRHALFGGSAMAATLLMPEIASAASGSTLDKKAGDARVRAVTFKNNGIDMAGNLYLPKNFSTTTKYPAIVSVHPGGGVKEQTAGLYALQLAVDKSGYGKKQLPAGRAWGVAVHESFSSVVAYVVEASVKDGNPVLHRVTSGVHCNLAVNPRSIEAQVQGAAMMGLSMCLPGAAITFKDGVVEQSNFGDYPVARMTDAPAFDVHIVPSADAPTGMGEPGLPPLAPAFANAIAQLTGQPLRELPFKLA